jgi:HSP20 family protein
MKTLVRWDPFRELDLMGRTMRSFGMPTVPAADVYETDDEYVVELEVPGYEENELAIEVLDHMLTIKGEHLVTTDETEKTYRLHERLEQEFERRFELPSNVDVDKVTATFKAGLLELHARKAEVAMPKKITVTV